MPIAAIHRVRGITLGFDSSEKSRHFARMTKRLDNPTKIRSGDEKKPYIIEGKRYYHVSAAARIAGVGQTTLWRWASKGVTSSGFELDVYHHLHYLLLIPEERVFALRDIVRQSQKTSESGAAPHP